MRRTKDISARIVDFFIFSNLLIAIAAFLFTLQTALNFHYSGPSAAFFAFTNFVSTFTLYNLQRVYQSTKPNTHNRLIWYERNRRLLFTLILIFASLYFIVFKVNYNIFMEGLLFYIPAAVLSLFYFLPPFALRRLPIFKIFFIALVWVITSIYIPLMYNDSSFSFTANLNKNEIAYLIAQFCFIAALCIPFDIRDYENDRQNLIRTLPVHFGLSTSKTIGIVLLLVYMVMAQNVQQAIVYFVTGTLGIVLTIYSSQHKHRYYFSVLVDGLIIVQFILFTFLFSGQ